MEAQAAIAAPPVAAARRDSGWRHFLYVTRALTVTEFKLRYFGSVLGYLWTLLRPLMLFGVLYLVFTHVVRFGDAVPHYPVVLLAAIVVFNYFSEATSGGLMQPRRAREPAAQGVLPARRGPDLGVDDRGCEPGAGSPGRVRVRVIDGVDPSDRLARLPRLRGGRDRARNRAVGAPVGAVRALPRRAADLGGRAPAAVLGHADHLHDADRRRGREHQQADHDEPARGPDPAGTALAGSRPAP